MDSQQALQAAKYKELCERIAEARSRGEDFLLRGARQIALYRWKSELTFKRVYGKERYPYTRQGSVICLSVDTAVRWERYLEFCAIRGLDPRREAEQHGFGPLQQPPKGSQPGETPAAQLHR